ncbi:type II toxin-antitoxin system RelE/ParE family toxin [uncultured Roseivirga sp.]|uniref:type II toxin-antitoxin system RelE/ParE family toxin n=1 Tax=uncultured Roseivirga sp. TaxID=543088 RepID=UPI000D78E8E2|nr:type II toxin-antitoxin system RelE/ParE family toxin [uncultured Roseivirga sp.]PWL29121.1 MAG: type II toxin-antitoxin system RelE/ParE family toxin [Roseivirga sp. XM-24bin3]
MNKKFEVVFLEEAIDFIDSLDIKARKKIYFNIDKAKDVNDPKLFKKLTNEIWEFRTKYNGLQYRLFAFWDKTDTTETLVISTHGIVKKVDKVPQKEIDKALKIRSDYFNL